MVGGSLWILRLLPPLKLVGMIKTPKIHQQNPKHLIQFIVLLQYLLDIVLVLDLQLPMSITTKVVRSNPDPFW
jgi:hypothetical protein